MSDYEPGAGVRTLEPEAGMRVRPVPDEHNDPGKRGWFGRLVYTESTPIRTYHGRMYVCRPGMALEPYTDQPIDLTDPATRYLALAQLARRVGLDPTWQVALRMVPDGWALDAGGVLLLLLAHGEDHATGGLTYAGVRKIREIDTTDPTEALDRALWATREVEP